MEQCERWIAFKITHYERWSERCSGVKFSSEAFLQQLHGSSFLDVCLKSESHVTIDLKYFNSVIWIVVSNTVEALIFPLAPRSPYESSMCCIVLHINCWLKTVLRFVCKRVVCPLAKWELYQHVSDAAFLCCCVKKKYHCFRTGVIQNTCTATDKP